jgi:transposase
MICSGECLFPKESPPFAHNGLLDSHRNWTRFRGSGQDDRAALTGIVFVLKSGIPWEMLPQEMAAEAG